MNVRSFTIKSNNGIHTVTNVKTVKKVVYKPRATQLENRMGEIEYQGYRDPDKYYHYTPDYSEVYQFQLVAVYGRTETLIEILPSKEMGSLMEDFIWEEIMNPFNNRMVDMRKFNRKVA